MKKVTVTLTFAASYKGTGTEALWTAYETDIPGIVVCRKPLWHWENGGEWYPANTWQVVHAGSGKPLHHKDWNIKTRALAMEAANNLPKMDWTRGARGMGHIEGLMAVTYATIREVL